MTITDYPLRSANLPIDPDLTNHYRFNGAFSDEEIYSITQLAPTDFTEGTAGGAVNKDYRDQLVTWISLSEQTEWIFEKVALMIEEANRQLWGFTLDGMREDFQFGRYKPGGFYGFHMDMPSKPNERGMRKVSVVVQLSSRDKFEGGDLQLLSSQTAQSMKMDRGDVVIFPSYMMHQVTPVTSGERYSLVLWAHGRSFQ